jgi:hypothetical protein
MSISLTKRGQERGCDSDGAEHPGDASAQGAYRARSFDTRPTHGCIPLFRHFYGRLCARALASRSESFAIQPYCKRANGALREELP